MRYCLYLLIFCLIYADCYSESEILTGPEIWEEIFVPTLEDKFSHENLTIHSVSSLLKAEGGRIVLDHGGTRTADPEVHTFLTRIANAFGLRVKNHYYFPSKHLEAIDLQLPNTNSFKWFSTLIKYEEFPQRVSKLIELDISANRPVLSKRGIELLEKLEQNHNISRPEAEELVKEIIYKYLKRHGQPISKTVLSEIAEESPEAANALLIGPSFNHLAISINDLAIPTWYGFETIEILEQRLRHEGFDLLPNIQGKIGSHLRQTSILADAYNFPVLIEGNITSSISYPSTYVEFIQRGIERDQNGHMVFDGKHARVYKGFLKENAEVIYASTNPKKNLIK